MQRQQLLTNARNGPDPHRNEGRRSPPIDRFGCDGAAGDVAECGYSEVDGGGSAGALVELGEFVFGSGEADLESFDFAEPVCAFGFGDADVKVVADLEDALSLGGVGPQEAAA